MEHARLCESEIGDRDNAITPQFSGSFSAPRRGANDVLDAVEISATQFVCLYVLPRLCIAGFKCAMSRSELRLGDALV